MAEISKNNVTDLLHQLSGLNETESLALLVKLFPGEVTFSTSFGLEDQAISHLIFSNNLDIKVFTLDTGRMFPETYSTWSRTIEKYNQKVTAYYPDANSLQQFIEERGPNSFYESIDNRKACCFIRKVEPLQRALKGNKIWITGIRAEQSNNRQDMPQVEWDEANQIIKFHPLLHWTWGEVKQFVSKNSVPTNPLHDKGFVSIGCAPCTRAIQPGEDFRAGRWWWEDNSKKECGLHIHEEAVKQD
ncbi:MAG: phosphoadenylyl-sulfate reductase [Sphingobacteriales bacterium]